MQYNEIQYAKRMLETGFIGKSYNVDLFILSKYLKHVLNLSKKDHVKQVKEFCEKYLIDYNDVLMGNKIDKAIENGRKLKNRPLVILSIPLYKEELDKINSLEITDDYKKILLSMLFNKKISHEKNKQIHLSGKESLYLGGNKKKYDEILKSSRTEGRYNIHNVISDLVKVGVLTSTYNGDIVLSFAEGISKSEVLYDVTPIDFHCVGLYLDLFLDNKKVKLCEDCNRIIKMNFGRPKRYCDGCAKIKQLVLAKNYKKKIKKDSKSKSI